MIVDYYKQDSLAKRFAHKRVKALEDQFDERNNSLDSQESQVQPANTVDQHSNLDANEDTVRQQIRNGDQDILFPDEKTTLIKWVENNNHSIFPNIPFERWESIVSKLKRVQTKDEAIKLLTSNGSTLSEKSISNKLSKMRSPEAREAQAKFPLKYRGHIIKVKGDQGGGHTAHVYRGDELKYTSKRHADPRGAVGMAKGWVDDESPAKDPREKDREGKGKKNNPFAICTESVGRSDKKKYNRCVDDIKTEHREGQQAFLQNPTDPTITQADPEMEALRTQAQELQAKIADIQAKAQAYTDALADKEGSNGQGMVGLQGEAARIQKELSDKILQLPENFVRFIDQTTYAKVQQARLNDPAWSQVINEAKVRGRGVMKRVTQILDRVSVLFQKLTTNVAIKEYPPGSFNEKERGKILKNNEKNTSKINQFEQDQLDVGNRAQKYFLDVAPGRMGVPGE
jgi:hypothetical protein